MSSTSAQQLRKIGEAMGLAGSELMNFVREQQTLEREDREKEDKHLELMRRYELEKKVKENERLEKLRLFEIEQKEKQKIFEIGQKKNRGYLK